MGVLLRVVGDGRKEGEIATGRALSASRDLAVGCFGERSVVEVHIIDLRLIHSSSV